MLRVYYSFYYSIYRVLTLTGINLSDRTKLSRAFVASTLLSVFELSNVMLITEISDRAVVLALLTLFLLVNSLIFLYNRNYERIIEGERNKSAFLKVIGLVYILASVLGLIHLNIEIY